MKKLIAAFLTALAFATPVFAQSINLPANTVYGRLGIGTGPGQAIPFSTLAGQLGFGNFITPEMHGAVGNGTTDDRAAWQSAINTAQVTGQAISCNKTYGIGLAPATTYGLQITSAVQIIGTGESSTLTPACQLRPLASLSTTNDVIQLRGSGPGTLSFLHIENIRIGGTAFGNRGIYANTICTTSCATPANRRWFVRAQFNRLFIDMPTAESFLLDNDVTTALSDPLGGMGLSNFYGGFYGTKIKLIQGGCCNIFSGGINMTGLPISFQASGVGGNVGNVIQNANIIGAVHLTPDGNGYVIADNWIEIGTASGGSNGAIVDLDGALTNVVIRGNKLINVTGSANASLLQHIRVGSGSSNIIIDENWFTSDSTQQAATGNWISNAGTETFIGKQYYGTGNVAEGSRVSNTGTFTEVAQYGRRAIANVNATATAADYIIAYGSISAARTVTLPLASSFAPGRKLCIRDDSGSASAVNTISADPVGSDTLQGSGTTQTVVNQAQGEACLESNGVNAWFIRLHSLLGDVTGGISEGNAIVTTLATAQPGAHTWSAQQTMSVSASFVPLVVTSSHAVGAQFTISATGAGGKQYAFLSHANGGAVPGAFTITSDTDATTIATFTSTYVALANKVRTQGAAPALTSCGTTPAISGSDLAGLVTMGTGTPTGCVITFNVAYAAAPYCVVTWQTNLASMQYTVSTTAITLVQTATSSNLVNYHCIARSGG